jgi:hypothetical protein
MNFWHLSDGIHLTGDNHGSGTSTSPWPSLNSLHSVIDTGGNGAGNGGSGHFFGSLVDSPIVIYMPINIAIAGYNSTADASQSNTASFDQSATQIAGIGGDGGNSNTSFGGNVSAGGTDSSYNSGAISSGGNQAGNGGDGVSHGSIVHASFILYEPINIAVAGPNSTAHAEQANNVEIDQSALQMAGVGGRGGNDNTSSGGDVGLSSSVFGKGSDAINTGHNDAGNGGSGHFSGSLVDSPIVIYMPINIAIAGYNSTADASQSNTAHFDQSATQIAGIGGDGGNGNVSMGGNVSASGFAGTAAIASGGEQAGNGGDGFFHGSIAHSPFILYEPINIAVAGPNSTVHAEQANNAEIDQSAVQMAGIGGKGGNGNTAGGGDVSMVFHGVGFGFGSDTIKTGFNDAGNGGTGHFSGNLIDAPVATYSPINIAFAQFKSTTVDAHQINKGDFDQSAMQMVGIGGDGGHGNVAFGGDVTMHGLMDHNPLFG